MGHGERLYVALEPDVNSAIRGAPTGHAPGMLIRPSVGACNTDPQRDGLAAMKPDPGIGAEPESFPADEAGVERRPTKGPLAVS
jgi:hypothetical protein